jgi:hypothetical protein
LRKWLHLSKAVKTLRRTGAGIDVVFLLYVDTYYVPGLPSRLFGLLLPVPWICLCLRPPHPRGGARSASVKDARLRRYALFRARQCRAVGVLEEGLMETKAPGLPAEKLLHFPDFADSSMPSSEHALVKRIREAARGKTVVATLGSLSGRKGVVALSKVAERLSAEPFLFVFAGKYAPESFAAAEGLLVEALMRTPPANCICHFEPLPDEATFNALVDVADILTVVYEQFPYSSNLVTKAALFRKLLIGTDQGCIGERIRRFELGVVEGLRTLRAGQEACLARAHFSDYMQLHSANRLDSVLDQMLGMVQQ